MSNRIVTIPKEKLVGGYSVNIYKPTYKDYSTALKLYPGETRDNPQGPGYTMEEFLCALCIRDGAGNEISGNPKDAIERFNAVDLKDKQYIMRTFISAFFIGQEDQDEADALADALYNADPNGMTYTLLKDMLPCNSSDLTFYRPSSAVQISVTKDYTSTRVNGCAWEEMLFLSCLTHVNGEPVDQSPNILSRVYELELLDVLYATAVFISMFSIGMNERKDATHLGKEWRVRKPLASVNAKPRSASPKTSTTPAPEDI
jgi:hypothetical protein